MRGRLVAAAGLWLALAAGCSKTTEPVGAADAPTVSDDLTEVAGLLREHTNEFDKGPAKLADLAKNEPLYPRGFAALRSGQIVVVWGAKVPVDGSGGTGVVAYERSTPTDVGNVLLANGKVKSMTATEFAAAPKG